MVKIYENPMRHDGLMNGELMSTTETDAILTKTKNGGLANGGQQHHASDDTSAIKAKQLDENGNRLADKVEDATSEADLSRVEELRSLLKKEYDDHDDFEGTYSKYHYDELMDPSSPNTCWRYLLHCDQDIEAAFELAKANLAWRKENRIDTIVAEDMMKDFWLRAPIGFTGKTKSGNDLVYAIGKNFRKPDVTVRQAIRDFICYVMFDWDRKHKHDLEQYEVVFDVSDTGLRNIDLDFSFWLVSVRDVTPARCKAIYFVGIPFLIRPVIKLIISWLPERFRRIAYCGTYDQLVRANIDDESIPEEIGGKADNKWRLAPIGSKWAHEHDSPEASEIFEKICKACNFNTSQEYLDRMYKMQLDYEKAQKQQL